MNMMKKSTLYIYIVYFPNKYLYAQDIQKENKKSGKKNPDKFKQMYDFVGNSKYAELHLVPWTRVFSAASRL